MNQTHENGQWMKLAEASRSLGVSEITLRRRVRSGKLRYESREGKYYVFVEKQASQPRPTSTLPNIRIPNIVPQDEIHYMREKLCKQDVLIQNLQRTLEDQQTLIAFLEDTLGKIAAQRNAI